MEVKIKSKIENITIELNENEADMLKDLLEFAFDYDTEHPHSLYTSEKTLGKELIKRLEFDSQSAKAEEKGFDKLSPEELTKEYNKVKRYPNSKCMSADQLQPLTNEDIKIFTEKLRQTPDRDKILNDLIFPSFIEDSQNAVKETMNYFDETEEDREIDLRGYCVNEQGLHKDYEEEETKNEKKV